jgi:hypothetical protein
MQVITFSPWLQEALPDTSNMFGFTGRDMRGEAAPYSTTSDPTWTIEYNGVEQSLEGWGVGGLQRNTASRARDIVSFRIIGDIVAALTFPEGAFLTIRRGRLLTNGTTWGGGTQWFVGEVVDPEKIGMALDESVDFVVAGPWYWLENIIYQQRYKTWVDGVWTWDISSHLFLGAKPDPANEFQILYISVKLQIVDILTWAIQAGAPFQVDQATIPDIAQWPNEVRDRTCAECIEQQLRFIPDTITWFDYSTTPPTLHFARAASLTAANFTLGTKPLSGQRIKKLGELKRDAVQIKYEITSEINNEQRLSIEKDTWPIGASVVGKNVMLATVDMRGVQMTIMSGYVTCSKIEPALATWWTKYYPWLDDSRVDWTKSSIVAWTIAGTEIGHPVSLTTHPRSCDRGQLAAWMNVIIPPATLPVPVIAARAKVMATAKIVYKTPTGTTPTLDKTETLTAQVTATNAFTGNYAALGSFTAADPRPADLAHCLYTAMNRDQFAGDVELTEQEVGTELIRQAITDRCGPGLVINIAGGSAEWATMAAVVQQCSEDVESGTTKFIIGPPGHLGATDIIEWLRMTRGRLIINNPRMLAGGNLGQSEGVLGKDTANDNTNAGLQHYTRFSMVDPTVPTPPAVAVGNLVFDVVDFHGKEIRVREIDVCVDHVIKKMLVACSLPYDATP